MFHSDWKTCLMDIDRDAEFSGDDVDQYSKLVDLGRAYETLVIEVPTIDSATVSVYTQSTPPVTVVPKAVHHGQVTGGTPAWETAAWATTAGTGAYFISCPIGGCQFVRIKTSVNQTADRTFYLRGVRS